MFSRGEFQELKVQGQHTPNGMVRRSGLSAALMVLMSMMLVQCGGGGGSPAPAPPPTVTGVTVSPVTAGIYAVEQKQFTATVSGTGAFDSRVTWSVNDIAGGSTIFGTITSAGIYTAPAKLPNPATVTVKAASVVDVTKSGLAQVIIQPDNPQISLSPSEATLQVSTRQQFTATVTGTGMKTVDWYVNSFLGGAPDIGTITSDGWYTAPALLPGQARVTITAQLRSQPSGAAKATVTLAATANGIQVTISPQNVDVAFKNTRQFTATVTGTTNTAVTWSAQFGQITQTGLYTAPDNNWLVDPQTDTIRAVSAANVGAQAAALVPITVPQPVLTGISSVDVPAGTEIDLTGEGIYSNDYLTVYFPGPDGTTIPAQGQLHNYPNGVRTTVPLGATSGDLYIETKLSNYPLQRSNVVSFQRLPAVRIRPEVRDLSSGETIQIYSRLLGDPAPRPVTWAAEDGMITASGTFTAPLVNSNKTIRIRACVENTQSCDAVLIGVHPFRITPVTPILGMSEQLNLAVNVGGYEVQPDWTVLAGGGAVDTNGLYTAPSDPMQSGGVTVKATHSGSQQNALISVTGAQPGMVNRIADYLDYTGTTAPYGTQPYQITSSGDFAYVLSGNTPGIYAVPHEYWIDVYNVADPKHPVWVDAVECVGCVGFTVPLLYAYGNSFYTATGGSYVGLNGNMIPAARYDVTPTAAIARGVAMIPDVAVHYYYNFSFGNGSFYNLGREPDGNLPRSWSSPTTVYRVAGSTMALENITVPLPNGPGSTATIYAVAGTGDKLFMCFVQPAYSNDPPVLVTYEIANGIASPIHSQPCEGVDWRLRDNYLFSGPVAYDISGDFPVKLYQLPIMASIEDGNDQLAITRTAASARWLYDVRDKSRPKLATTVVDADVDVWSVRLLGGHLLTAGPNGGIGIYDIGYPGGQRWIEAITGIGYAVGYDVVASNGRLYRAEVSDVGPGVDVYDITVTPAVRLSRYTPNGTPYSLQLSGIYLFVGTDQGLEVLQIGTAGDLSSIGSIALPISCIALAGQTIYAGTNDKRLVAIDVSNPQSPVLGAALNLPDIPMTARVSGNFLLLADGSSGLLLYDISVPGSPILRSQLLGSGEIGDVRADGRLAFLADFSGYLIIADLTNPTSPQVISRTALQMLGRATPNAIAIALNSGVVYVGTYTSGMVYGYEYSRPEFPRLVSLQPYNRMLAYGVYAMAFSGNEMFVVGDLEVSVIERMDVSQPRNVIGLFPPGAPGSITQQSVMADAPLEIRRRSARQHLDRPRHTSGPTRQLRMLF